MISTRKPNQYYIKQFVCNDNNNPALWTDESLSELVNKDSIIGYLFINKGEIVFGKEVITLNLYLMNPEYYNDEPVLLKDLRDAWNRITEQSEPLNIVFKNPPIQQWLDTKKEWCSKLATSLVKKYGLEYDEAMSEIYFTLLKAYRKMTVYVGNLNYISTAVNNNIKLIHRDEQRKLTLNNPNVYSGEMIIRGVRKNDDTMVTLFDMIPYEDSGYSECETKEFESLIDNLLSEEFSEREIEQIKKLPLSLLPASIYRRLLRWRKKHSIKEIMQIYENY